MTFPLNLVTLSPFLIGLVANRPKPAPGIEEGLTSHLSRSPEAFVWNEPEALARSEPEAFVEGGVADVADGTCMGGGGGGAAPSMFTDLGDPSSEGLGGAIDLGDPTVEGLRAVEGDGGGVCGCGGDGGL